jgi:hypothetical protein
MGVPCEYRFANDASAVAGFVPASRVFAKYGQVNLSGCFCFVFLKQAESAGALACTSSKHAPVFVHYRDAQ